MMLLRKAAWSFYHGNIKSDVGLEGWQYAPLLNHMRTPISELEWSNSVDQRFRGSEFAVNHQDRKPW